MHFVREMVARRQLSVRYIPTEEQVADVLTKDLSVSKFTTFRSKLHITPLDMSWEGVY